MIYRKDKFDNFTKIDNDLFRNNELLGNEKLILIYALTNVDDWDFTEKKISNACNLGMRLVRKALDGLEEKRYLNKKRIHENGRFKKYQYDFYESPELNNEDEDKKISFEDLLPF